MRISAIKPIFFIVSMLLFSVIYHLSLAEEGSVAGEDLIEKFVGKDGLMSPQKIPDGCADDLNPEALKIVEAANRDYWIKGKTRDAAIRLEKAIKLDPRLYAAYPNLKFHYCWALKQCDRAITIVENGIKHCQNWPGHNETLAGIYSRMGKYQLALKEYGKAQAKGVTESTSFYYNLGNTHGKLKHYDEAITNFLKSLEMDKKHFNARKNLIVTFAMHNKNQQALKQIEILLKLEPDEKMKLWANRARQHLSK